MALLKYGLTLVSLVKLSVITYSKLYDLVWLLRLLLFKVFETFSYCFIASIYIEADASLEV